MITARERSIIANLKKYEEEERRVLQSIMKLRESNPDDEKLRNVEICQTNRWSVAYRILHETENIIDNHYSSVVR